MMCKPDLEKDIILVFDLDGTLWDSAQTVAESWNIILAQEAPSLPPFTTEDIHSVMGLTMTEIAERLQPGMDNSRRHEIFKKCNSFEVGYIAEHGGMVYPGLRPVMEQLKSQGCTLAIVSNCQLGYVRSFLTYTRTGDLFTDYEEWEHTGLTKGENIRLVMARNGFSKAIYIGDTVKDQEAARTAGIPFIHAAYGFGTVESPDGIIHDLAELPAEIRRMTERFPESFH